jgi:hypothetical protein
MLFGHEGDTIPLDKQCMHTSTSLNSNIHIALNASGRVTVQAASIQQKRLLVHVAIVLWHRATTVSLEILDLGSWPSATVCVM